MFYYEKTMPIRSRTRCARTSKIILKSITYRISFLRPILRRFLSLQDVSKRPPRRLETPPRRPQTPPRRSKTSVRRLKTPPRRSKTVPKTFQDGSKALREASKAILKQFLSNP